jgi:hypothetical protein
MSEIRFWVNVGVWEPRAAEDAQPQVEMIMGEIRSQTMDLGFMSSGAGSEIIPSTR